MYINSKYGHSKYAGPIVFWTFVFFTISSVNMPSKYVKCRKGVFKTPLQNKIAKYFMVDQYSIKMIIMKKLH